jgi:RNA polymerase sigma factor (sigma-70 family)
VAHAESTAEVLAFPNDRDLLDRARVGDTDAFEELYRRHAQAAWRLAQAVTRNSDDASDAVSEAFTKVFAALQAGTWSSEAPFRPYLLTAVRNAAIDAMRRSGRFTPADEADHLAPVPTTAAASDHVVRLEDAALVAAAFRALPERWRSVLWLTEVEGVPAREAAATLGLSPNSTAQLAVRARAGLRERYLQAHLQQTGELRCRATIERLGAYVAGGLSARDIAKVDQHLAGCASCKTRHDELEDVGTGLRRVALPLPAVLATAAGAKWRAAGAVAGKEAGVLDFEQILDAPLFRKVLGAAAAAIFTAGMIAAPFIGDDGTTGLPLAAPDVVQFENTAEEPLIVPEVAAPLAFDPGPAVSFDSGADRVAAYTVKRSSSPSPAPSVAPADTGAPAPGEEKARVAPDEPAGPAPASTTPTTTPLLPPLPLPTVPGVTGEGGALEAPPTTQAPPVATVGVGSRSGDGAGAVSVAITDTAEAGAQVGDTIIGTPQSQPPAEEGVTVQVGGGALPTTEVTVPLP